MLNAAQTRALQMGPDVAADAKHLAMARAMTPLAYPVLPDGSRVPAGTKVLLLLVIDPTGHPLRGHILNKNADAAAAAVLASAMQGLYAHDPAPAVAKPL